MTSAFSFGNFYALLKPSGRTGTSTDGWSRWHRPRAWNQSFVLWLIDQVYSTTVSIMKVTRASRWLQNTPGWTRLIPTRCTTVLASRDQHRRGIMTSRTKHQNTPSVPKHLGTASTAVPQNSPQDTGSVPQASSVRCKGRHPMLWRAASYEGNCPASNTKRARGLKMVAALRGR